MLHPASAESGNYFPTYLGPSVFWKSATPLILNQDIFNADISLRPVPGAVTGTGSISGTVNYSDKHPVHKGGPAKGIEILLLSQGNQPQKVWFTDSSGTFSFSTLGFGNYKVYAEVPGITTFPADALINQSNPVVSNIQLLIEHMYVVSVGEEIPGNGFFSSLFPNPARHTLNLSFNSETRESIQLHILDPGGRVLFTSAKEIQAGDTMIEVDISFLKPGIYFLLAGNTDYQRSMKKFIKIQ
jgi:hypothetical protein